MESVKALYVLNRRAVDCGKYPDHHTKDLFEAAVASNQVGASFRWLSIAVDRVRMNCSANSFERDLEGRGCASCRIGIAGTVW